MDDGPADIELWESDDENKVDPATLNWKSRHPPKVRVGQLLRLYIWQTLQ